MIVYLARDILVSVMYCVYGASRSSLLIESTDSMISDSMILKNEKHFFYEQNNRDAAAKKNRYKRSREK